MSAISSTYTRPTSVRIDQCPSAGPQKELSSPEKAAILSRLTFVIAEGTTELASYPLGGALPDIEYHSSRTYTILQRENPRECNEFDGHIVITTLTENNGEGEDRRVVFTLRVVSDANPMVFNSRVLSEKVSKV